MRDVNIVLSVLQGLLAAFFLAAGASHLLMPMARLKAGAPWTEDVGGPRTRMIGLLEMLAAIGLVLPSRYVARGIVGTSRTMEVQLRPDTVATIA
jgi:DoxX-like family